MTGGADRDTRFWRITCVLTPLWTCLVLIDWVAYDPTASVSRMFSTVCFTLVAVTQWMSLIGQWRRRRASNGHGGDSPGE